jgi:hypothetical protein
VVAVLVYDLPVGRGRHFLNSSSALTDTLLGGWQISAINTMQAGTPFNVGYSPNSANAESPLKSPIPSAEPMNTVPMSSSDSHPSRRRS